MIKIIIKRIMKISKNCFTLKLIKEIIKREELNLIILLKYNSKNFFLSLRKIISEKFLYTFIIEEFIWLEAILTFFPCFNEN